MSKDTLFETQEQPIALAAVEDRFDHRFAIEALVGSGPTGAIFRAHDRSSDCRVALRVWLPLDLDEAVRFLRDLKVLASLNHPAIVHHVAHGLTPQRQPYLAVEWLRGEDLRCRLARGNLTHALTARLGSRVLQGLASAQSQGLVHGALTPSKLFLPDQDPLQVVMLDMGTGLFRPQVQATSRATATADPCSLAPERRLGSEIPNQHTDVFALGCILHECVTGHGPDPRASKHPQDGMVDGCAVVPQPLRTILERMLANNPDERPVDLAGMASELSEAARVLERIEPRFAIAVPARETVCDPLDRGPRKPPYTLFGQSVPCFGRERELDLLEGVWHEVCETSTARAIVITAPAGGGKTRLRQEFCDRLTHHGPAFELLVGSGDPLCDGAPFSSLRPILACAAGPTGGEPLAERRQALRAEVGRLMPPGKVEQVAAFLGEMALTPFEVDAVWLRAARLCPRLMADRVHAAWLEWLEALCSRRPVLLILDDLHWGDGASAALTEAALGRLRDRPLMVMALAQPEMNSRFMRLWEKHAPQRLYLAPLSSRQSQRLVEYVVGSSSAARVRTMVEHTQGNPFYLEELLRVVLSGRELGSELALASELVQARLQKLDPETGLILSACSIFGQPVRSDAVKAVVEGSARLDVEHCLDLLEEQEILFSHQSVAGREIDFRHVLVRQAAYDKMSRDERALGHLLAGRFLEQAEVPDAHALAAHFEAARDIPRAFHWLRQAAKQALAADDVAGTLALTDRARNLEGSEENERAFHDIEAQIRLSQGEYREAELAARVATSSEIGAIRWSATRSLLASLTAQSKRDETTTWVTRIAEPPEEPESFATWLECLKAALPVLLEHSEDRIRESLSRKIQEALERAGPSPCFQGHAESLLAHLARAMGHPTQSQARFARAAQHHASLGDHRSECEALAHLGHLLLITGQLDRAESTLRPLLGMARRLGLEAFQVAAAEDLSRVLAYRGHWDEARELGHQALSLANARDDRHGRRSAESCVSLIELLAGNYALAEKFAVAGAAIGEGDVQGRSFAQSLLARSLLGQARTSEALQHAREAYALLGSSGSIEGFQGSTHLAMIECLLAVGDRAAAHEGLHKARKRLHMLADTIDDQSVRSSFLSALPEHQRLLKLCRQAGLGG